MFYKYKSLDNNKTQFIFNIKNHHCLVSNFDTIAWQVIRSYWFMILTAGFWQWYNADIKVMP